jgi:hypothetical protein
LRVRAGASPRKARAMTWAPTRFPTYSKPTSAYAIGIHAVTDTMSFNTPWFNQQDKSFFNALNISKVVHVIIAAESEDFAEEVIQQWKAEGFNVIYVPFGNGGKDFVARVKYAGDNIGVSEQYAVVGNSHRYHDINMRSKAIIQI